MGKLDWSQPPPVNITWDYEYLTPPFPPFYIPVIVVIIYAIVLYTIVKVMKNREGFKLTGLFLLHNVILCLISSVLFLGISFEVFRTWYYHGLHAVYCGSGDDEWDAKMLKWGVWFYLSKFYELFDTIFLAVRKKPLTVLHVFHHILVATACWLEIRAEMYFGWIAGINNTFIHIIMYYYFGSQCVYPREVWWKRYLTLAQILQFIVDSLTSMPWLYFYLTGSACRGDIRAWILANTGGIMLTVLFLNFYRHAYRREQKVTKKD